MTSPSSHELKRLPPRNPDAHTNSETGTEITHHTKEASDLWEHILKYAQRNSLDLIPLLLLTFLGRSVCPICAGNASLEWGPWCNPWDFSQSSQTLLSGLLHVTKHLNSSKNESVSCFYVQIILHLLTVVCFAESTPTIIWSVNNILDGSETERQTFAHVIYWSVFHLKILSYFSVCRHFFPMRCDCLSWLHVPDTTSWKAQTQEHRPCHICLVCTKENVDAMSCYSTCRSGGIGTHANVYRRHCAKCNHCQSNFQWSKASFRL